MPARAPASIAILQMVIRPSMLKARITSPPNSIAKPLPPAVPILPITAKATSLAVTPTPNSPSTRTNKRLDFLAIKVCVAITCSTSEVPIPCAKAPNAPCVEVWLSPHTTVMPGNVVPFSGPIT